MAQALLRDRTGIASGSRISERRCHASSRRQPNRLSASVPFRDAALLIDDQDRV